MDKSSMADQLGFEFRKVVEFRMDRISMDELIKVLAQEIHLLCSLSDFPIALVYQVSSTDEGSKLLTLEVNSPKNFSFLTIFTGCSQTN